MITEKLIAIFIKDSDKIELERVRNQYGYLAGLVGIILNVMLFLLKFLIGVASGSIAILADAFNNFSDMASSVVTIVGFKLAARPADKDHPFGHGRSEYISAMIVAFMVMFVGVQFIQSSFERLLNPTPVAFEWIPFLILLSSIFIKVWLSVFNRTLGTKINSTALKATATDAMGDVITSSVVLLSYAIAQFTAFPLDGLVGIVVAIGILIAGYNLVKETISPLLGEAPDDTLVEQIETSVLSYQHIIGVHDLIVHNYGVHKVMASIHAEIPSHLDVMTIHDIIDQAEREISEKLGIYLVIHMDPILLECEEVKEVCKALDYIVDTHPAIQSYHDLRIIEEAERMNLYFDLVIQANLLTKHLTAESIKSYVTYELFKQYPMYRCVITLDQSFK